MYNRLGKLCCRKKLLFMYDPSHRITSIKKNSLTLAVNRVVSLFSPVWKICFELPLPGFPFSDPPSSAFHTVWQANINYQLTFTYSVHLVCF